jgi:hypothetical protein
VCSEVRFLPDYLLSNLNELSSLRADASANASHSDAWTASWGPCRVHLSRPSKPLWYSGLSKALRAHRESRSPEAHSGQSRERSEYSSPWTQSVPARYLYRIKNLNKMIPKLLKCEIRENRLLGKSSFGLPLFFAM